MRINRTRNAVRRPGIEPGSAAWGTTMLATAPPALGAELVPNVS